MSAPAALITSPDNPRLRRIRLLRDEQPRRESGLFLVEGLRFLLRARESGAEFIELVVAPELLLPAEHGLVSRLRREGLPVIETSPRVFANLSRAADPTGLAAVLRQRWGSLERASPGLWVVADGLGFSGNLGTLVRTCEAAGATGLFVTPDTADPFGPTAVRASMGSIFAMSLVRANWNEIAQWCRGSRSRLIGTSPHGGTSYRAADLSGPIVVAFGSEGSGLGHRELDRCDDVLSVPMAGRLDSLNLAVAAGIVLFEAFHQRHPAGDVASTTHPGA